MARGVRQEATVKKGTAPSWKPASMLGNLRVPEGYKGRWCDADAANVEKKKSEGWQAINKTNFPDAERFGGLEEKDVKDRNDAGGVRYRELVGMMLPIEDLNNDGKCVTKRNEYFAEITEQNTKARVRAEANKSSILGKELAEQGGFKGRLEIIE